MSVAIGGAVQNRLAVHVRPEPGASVAEELLLLAALEQFKRHADTVSLTYAAQNEEIIPLLTRRWFLADSYLCRSEAAWEEFSSQAIGVTVPEPDPLEAVQAEQALYEAAFSRETQRIEQQQQAILQAGMKDLILPKPEYGFQPRWHKSNAYVWALADLLGTMVPVPDEPLAPFWEAPRALLGERQRALKKAGFLKRPFLVYDLAGLAQPFAAMVQLADVMGSAVTMLAAAEIRSAVGDDIATWLSLFSQPQALFAVANSGKLLTAAWAANVPGLIELYDGAHPAWDGAQGPGVFRIEQDRYTPEQQAPALNQAAQLMLRQFRKAR
jgi:hypothetical protein